MLQQSFAYCSKISESDINPGKKDVQGKKTLVLSDWWKSKFVILPSFLYVL
jgi:hypothetical protein